MNQFLFLLFTCLLLFPAGAQENNFIISRTYFAGETVHMFSESRGAAVTVLANGKVFLMNKQQEFTEITNLLDEQVIQDVSCIESVNEEIFLIGTHSHSLYLYENGEVTNLKSLNPSLPDQINSIDFSGFEQSNQIMVATSENVFISSDFRHYESAPLPYTNDVHFFESRATTLLNQYDRCGELPDNLGLQVHGSFGTVLYGIYQDDTYNFERLNAVHFVKKGYGSGTYNLFALYGTDNGIYAHHINSCSKEVVRHFSGNEVYDFSSTGLGLPTKSILVATEEGLLSLETNAHYYDVYNPVYVTVPGIERATVVTYSIYHNNIWVATNDGLKVITEDNMTRASFDIPSHSFETRDMCKTAGANLGINVNNQMDIQWYRNQELIDGAITMQIHVYDTGTYSVAVSESDDEVTKWDVAYVKYDTIFKERLRKGDSVLCPDEYNVGLRIDNINDNTHDHYIRWYSVENGLEMDGGLDNNYFSTQQGGHYFFTATNCNDYVYTSDTIEVIISQLQTPSFRSDPRAEDICEGDSILLDNIDFAQNIDWWVDYYKAENHNLPYYIPSYENSEDYLRVEVSDHYGCTQSVFSQLKYVLEAPYLPTRDYYICSSAEYVSLDLPYLSEAIWEGFSNDQHLPVSEGSYPITVTNGVCPDLETSIYVHEFDPLPFNTTDTTLALGDTLKVQGSGQNFPQSWSYDWTFDWQKNELFITSNLPSTYTVQLGYFSHCWRSYTLNIEFEEIILNSPIPTGQFLYPNPTDGRVHFNNSKNEISNIEILDLNGKKLAVIHTIPVNLNASLNLSDYLSSGSYILWFNYNNGTTSQHKVVLN